MIARRLLALIVIGLLAPAPAGATVNSQTSKTIVLGDGHTTAFAFSFIGVAAQYITVIYTDTGGNQTTLSQGSGATQYQISLNAAVQGAIWGMGGTVTYNPNSVPIASGTTLTIYRTLPLTQAVTLQNLASIAVLGKGAETGLDTGVMQSQQINETINRSIRANIANSTAPADLPPAAQMANKGLCGDSTGLNVTACVLPSSGVISSAMQPVVNAVTLAAGRTAFGLGSMAQENIGGGTCGGASIQDDGSAGGANGVGYARVVYAVTSDSINQSVTCAFHNTERIATGPITYTLPRGSTTLFNGWGFRIDAFTDIITVTPNANDNFTGVAAGTSVAIAPGASCWISTNAASSATWLMDCSTVSPSLSASASGNALTLSLNVPAVAFRNTTLATGVPVPAIPAAGLSITIPASATLGTSSSNVPFRIWVFVAYNSGTPILGVATCSTATAVMPCAAWETIRKSGTAITAASTAAGTLYTSSAAGNDSVRIVGYAEYASGLATAGTWASGPTTLQVCLPPFSCRKPGDVVQNVFATSSSSHAETTGTPSATNSTAQITLSSSVNLVEAIANGSLTAGAASVRSAPLLERKIGAGAFTSILSGSDAVQTAGAGILETPSSMYFLDLPGSGSALTYTVFIFNNGSAGTATYGAGGTQTMILREIMGAIDPANDNGALSALG